SYDADSRHLLVSLMLFTRPPASSPLSLHDALPICHLEAALAFGHHQLFRSEPAQHLAQGADANAVILFQPVQLELFGRGQTAERSEEHTSELQSRENLVCRLLLEKKK